MAYMLPKRDIILRWYTGPQQFEEEKYSSWFEVGRKITQLQSQGILPWLWDPLPGEWRHIAW